MSLYQLISIEPLGLLYGRSREDFSSWIEEIKRRSDKDPKTYSREPPYSQILTPNIAEEVEKGVLRIDLGGIIRTKADGKLSMAEFPLTEDFRVEILTEAIPSFKGYQEIISANKEKNKVGNLYGVPGENMQGVFFWNYLPLDVFEALSDFDPSPYEGFAKKHKEKTLRLLKEDGF